MLNSFRLSNSGSSSPPPGGIFAAMTISYLKQVNKSPKQKGKKYDFRRTWYYVKSEVTCDPNYRALSMSCAFVRIELHKKQLPSRLLYSRGESLRIFLTATSFDEAQSDRYHEVLPQAVHSVHTSSFMYGSYGCKTCFISSTRFESRYQYRLVTRQRIRINYRNVGILNMTQELDTVQFNDSTTVSHI